ncbi:MAG: virulence protein SciE type [Gammaproteobacteria bacterium 13_2_20CM_66_19]|nr:MAG: virulence protein SciE type [Gammaproteobacteria bacterium 13_2_20CM_66_19]TLZ19709.1 MAG: virulence protein SciE type [Gammaproteobacteria bacterium]TLZ25301.1 MAG: virulence protein SciE type [Gammaproteobacteria bacterium]TLZ39065.1 MAG: virulence protein SciE type [Gammaproteobacteria bacterium]
MTDDRARELLRAGELAASLAVLQDQVRGDPSNAEKRVFLFQLLSVLGQWERAATQLEVAAELDAKTLAMAQMYREALKCEALRVDVFAGRKSPLIFGEPEEWLALLIEALLVQGSERGGQADALRARALELAPASSGAINGERFEWIADADSRLGPVCEAVINGRYYWVPFARLARLDIEEPTDLRDVAWTPVHFQFTNGGESVGIIPSRYPGSEAAEDPTLCLARQTAWLQVRPDVYEGLGQRVLATDAGEYPLFEARSIVFDEAPAARGATDG